MRDVFRVSKQLKRKRRTGEGGGGDRWRSRRRRRRRRNLPKHGLVGNNMSIKCVLLVLCYHLLLGGAVSEFTPTVYPAKILSSSQCDQGNPLYDQQLIEVLNQILQQIPSRTSCMDIYTHCLSISSLRLLRYSCCQWLSCAGLL